MALLLYLLPNLEELDCYWIGNGIHQVDLMLQRMVAGDKPFDHRPGLSHLRRAHIWMSRSAMGGISIEQIRPFYQLPSMKVLKGTDGYRWLRAG
ncbi:hypothetical protein BDV36DRAFT_274047 [Aspergillus pseudocaelatus]|uniref:Uncharacterized protein n=1 Tax=Aspergillus pseudocaelatus TaxID=1825620 RepID=A0ABQ6W4S5_9EURO|nr:hypothetical protein BDV36DRAFT_274047 [Aspergillus pseudocaelatus]